MLAFIDIDTCIKDLEKKAMKYMNAILSLPFGTSHARIRASIALIRTKSNLACRLIKALYKYERVFGVRIRRYDDHIIQTMNQEMGIKFQQIESFQQAGWRSLREFIDHIEHQSLKTDCNEIGVNFTNTYRLAVKNEIYTTYDRIAIYVLKYFTNSAYYKERYQDLCGCKQVICSREHITDEQFNKLREETKEELKKLGVMMDIDKLSEIFNKLYFCPLRIES